MIVIKPKMRNNICNTAHPHGYAAQVDYEYQRLGTANKFMITEPLRGWRKVNVRETKTAVDLAQEIRELLDVDVTTQ